MPTDQALRQMSVNLPARPRVVTRLATLLADPAADMRDLSDLVESDMAIAAAVMKAVNSAYYGLSRDAGTVLEAIAFLGMQQVAAVTLEMSLRAVFPASAALDAIWQRASDRSHSMSKLARALNLTTGDAHAAGLFEECGKALLLRHDSTRYAEVQALARDETDLLLREQHCFGVSHDHLGASLCETWGLSQAAVHSVRAHVAVQTSLRLPQRPLARPVAALSLLVHAAMGSDLERENACITTVAQQMHWDAAGLQAAVQRVRTDLASLAGAHPVSS